MAKVKIQGHASGTGILTVTAPNTSTDRTITLPDATGTLLNSDGSGANLSGVATLDGNSNLGVGTTSPTNLGNYKTIATNDSSGGMFEIMVGGTRTANIQSSASQCNIQTRTNIPIAFDINSSEKMRLTSDGLTFNGDTAAANALDDYEEGTYTYTITGNTSGSMTPRSGYNHFAYTKIGRLVTVQGKFETSGSHTASGMLKVSLPFSSHDGVSHSAQGTGTASIYRAGANFNNLRATVFNNSNYFVFYYNEGGTGDSDATVQGSDVDATMEGTISLTYMT